MTRENEAVGVYEDDLETEVDLDELETGVSTFEFEAETEVDLEEKIEVVSGVERPIEPKFSIEDHIEVESQHLAGSDSGPSPTGEGGREKKPTEEPSSESIPDPESLLYEELFVTVDFETRECASCGAEVDHQVVRDHHEAEETAECSACHAETTSTFELVADGGHLKAGMDRVTVRVPRKHVDELEQLVEIGDFPNRSEAFRTAIREFLKRRTGR